MTDRQSHPQPSGRATNSEADRAADRMGRHEEPSVVDLVTDPETFDRWQRRREKEERSGGERASGGASGIAADDRRHRDDVQRTDGRRTDDGPLDR